MRKPGLKAMLWVVVARFGFCIFFLWNFPRYTCTSGVASENSNCGKGPIIKQDEVAVLLMVIFTLTNGWPNTVLFMKATEMLTKPEDIDMGSRLMVFMLISGLMTGGIISTIISSVVG